MLSFLYNATATTEIYTLSLHDALPISAEMKSIQTTVYRLPCAGFAEKDGTFVNSARWLQWKNIAVTPPGERSEEHTSELQSLRHLVCRLLLEKKKKKGSNVNKY